MHTSPAKLPPLQPFLSCNNINLVKNTASKKILKEENTCICFWGTNSHSLQTLMNREARRKGEGKKLYLYTCMYTHTRAKQTSSNPQTLFIFHHFQTSYANRHKATAANPEITQHKSDCPAPCSCAHMCTFTALWWTHCLLSKGWSIFKNKKSTHRIIFAKARTEWALWTFS